MHNSLVTRISYKILQKIGVMFVKICSEHSVSIVGRQDVRMLRTKIDEQYVKVLWEGVRNVG